MKTGQAVPQPDGAVFLPGQIPGISQIAQFVVPQRLPRLLGLLEIPGGQFRILGRSVQQVRGIDRHADSAQLPAPEADRQAFLQQRLRPGPFPGVQIGGRQPQGHLRPIQGILLRIEGQPRLPQVDRVLADVECLVVRIRHGAADQAFQMPVSRDPRLFQRFLEGDDGLVILVPIVGDQPPMVPEPSLRRGIPLRGEPGQGGFQQFRIDGIDAGLIEPDDRVQGRIRLSPLGFAPTAANQQQKQEDQDRDPGFHRVLSLAREHSNQHLGAAPDMGPRRK